MLYVAELLSFGKSYSDRVKFNDPVLSAVQEIFLTVECLLMIGMLVAVQVLSFLTVVSVFVNVTIWSRFC